MRFLLICNLMLLCCVNVIAQQDKEFRSDTINFSVQARYLLVSFGAGVEFPFRQHSFGFQVGFNGVPVEGNIYLGFNVDKIGALEYKRYYTNKSSLSKQFYYGSYLLFKNTKYASPHEEDWEGDWYDSNSINLGPFWGIKWYKGPRTYFDFYIGGHGGWRWGELRWDNNDPVTNIRNPTYQQASKAVYGIRMGLSFGFHPIGKVK